MPTYGYNDELIENPKNLEEGFHNREIENQPFGNSYQSFAEANMKAAFRALSDQLSNEIYGNNPFLAKIPKD